MKEKVELYDPHPGFAGAAIPLPRLMKDAADKLNGQQMTLEEAVKQLTEPAEKIGGTIEIVEKYKFIGFRLGDIERPPYHFFRLIRYK